MAFFVVLSFWQVEYFELSTEPTLANYRDVFANYWHVMGYTVVLATATALLTTALGFVFSFLARFRAGDWAQALLFIVLITLFGGYLMKIYAWKTILGNEGVLNTALMALGIISTPISSLLYSPQAVVVTLMHFSLPFAVLPIYASMRGITDSEVEAGARSRRRPLVDPFDRHRAALPERHRRRLQLRLPDRRRRLRHAAARRRQADDDRQSHRAAVRRTVQLAARLGHVLRHARGRGCW